MTQSAYSLTRPQKLFVVCSAILITALIYGAHWVIDRYLGEEKATEMVLLAEED